MSHDVVQLMGRTSCDRIVVFDGPERLAGSILPVVIEQVDAFTLTGGTHRSSFLISDSSSVVETLRLTTLPS